MTIPYTNTISEKTSVKYLCNVKCCMYLPFNDGNGIQVHEVNMETEEGISNNEVKVSGRAAETNILNDQSSIDMDEHQEAKLKEFRRNVGNTLGSVSSTKTVSVAKSNLDKKARPKRKAALKTKFYSHNSESDDLHTCMLNCVMCTQNFKELVDLESHVRAHDEVIHFSLVLKPLVSKNWIKERTSLK